MASAMRILFVSGEVAPFTTQTSEIARVVRSLPELLHDSGDFEVRIMMPRYGTISERRNRLHEVIRLSGDTIETVSGHQALKVKVASIPGIRLQVYFMDNVHYFKRKGLVAGKDEKLFADNAERALFFGRAVLHTINNLGWKPDVVHGFGWAAGLVPRLLKTDYDGHELLGTARSVYTPDAVEAGAALTEELATSVELDPDTVGLTTAEVGMKTADTVIYPPSMTPSNGVRARFGDDPEANRALAAEVYEMIAGGVPA